MSFKAASSLLLIAALSGVGRAVDLCPKLNDIGHAQPQPWVFSSLNWTLTKETSGATWPLPDDDFDESRAIFEIQSDFNDAPVRCDMEGREFSEEYLRQLAGRDPSYGWYECEGPSTSVKTEFKMVWWNAHTVDIRQTWTCPTTGRPMRATGQLQMTEFDCEFNDESKRTSCVSRAGSRLPFDATIVEVLPAPTRECAAASEKTPDWNVLDLTWVTRTTTFGLDPGSANVTFRLVNEALDYSPRMTCTEPFLQRGSHLPYTCTVFEANEADVPPTTFDFAADETRLSIDQTWYCNDDAGKEKTFRSYGERDIGSLLTCTSVDHEYESSGGIWVETFKTCVTKSDFEIKGKLQ